MERDEAALRDPAQHEVLGVRGAHLAVAELAREAGERVQLLAGHVAERELDGDDAVAGLLLGDGVGAQPARERRVAERVAAGLGRRGLGLLVGRDRRSRAPRRGRAPRSAWTRANSSSRRLQELRLADLAEQELEAVLLPVLALAVAEEDVHDRLARGEELALGDELAPEVGDFRRRAEAAGDVDAEAAAGLGRTAAKRPMSLIMACARSRSLPETRDLEFARELPVVLVEEEVIAHRLRVRGDVEHLVRRRRRRGATR